MPVDGPAEQVGGGAEEQVGGGVGERFGGGASGRIVGGAKEFIPVLPGRLSRLIGRESALEGLGTVLRGARLVTLTGPGGVGKTSLAIEAAARLGERWADGCRLIELGAVGDAKTAVAVIRAELGEAAHVCLVHRPAVLGVGALLLILDNCEHVLEIAGLVADLLRGYPNLTVLATSREPLGIPGETLFPVAPRRRGIARSIPRSSGVGSRSASRNG